MDSEAEAIYRWHREYLVKMFFYCRFDCFLAIYQAINGSFDLDARSWHSYVNSRELFSIAHVSMSKVSGFIRSAICMEPIEQIGNVMLAGNEVYFAVPEKKNASPNAESESVHNASVCFIVMLNHMLFRYLCHEPFVILKGHNGSTPVRINNNLEYELVERYEEETDDILVLLEE